VHKYISYIFKFICILDEKFPVDHKVSLIFAKAAEKAGINRTYDDILIFQNPLIRKEPISNYSSIADLSQYAGSQRDHMMGPLDGSLYATVAKSPTTPNNELTVQNIQTIETRLNTPTSKNSRILSTILEWDNVRNENGHIHHHNEPTYQTQTIATRSASRQQSQEPQLKSPLMRSYDSGIYSHEVTNSKQK
jgi:hypothetical protein